MCAGCSLDALVSIGTARWPCCCLVSFECSLPSGCHCLPGVALARCFALYWPWLSCPLQRQTHGGLGGVPLHSLWMRRWPERAPLKRDSLSHAILSFGGCQVEASASCFMGGSLCVLNVCYSEVESCSYSLPRLVLSFDGSFGSIRHAKAPVSLLGLIILRLS